MKRLRSSCLAVVTAVLAAAGAGEVPPTARIEITLEDAARDPNGQKAKPFVIAVTRNHGVLENVVCGSARSFHQSDYPGRITESSLAADRLSLSVTLRELPDLWSPPGDWCRFEVDCAPDAKGGFSGKWKGMFRGIPGEGGARAAVVPLRESPGAGPLKPGEHPLLLIRPSDIQALKAKMVTPWGQAEVERLRNLAAGKGGPDTEGPTARAVALGLLYHLTGDRTFADQGRALLLADLPNWYNVMYVHGAAACVSQGALAYDLLRPTADAPWREKMLSAFRAKMSYLYFPPVGGFNNKDGSNWNAMYRSALGMAALVILSDPAPPQPRMPAAAGIRNFPPRRETTDAGEVVAPLVPDRAIGAWLHAGPFLVDSTNSVVPPAGAAPFRPVAGLAVAYTTANGDKAECPFAPLPADCLVPAAKALAYGKPHFEGGIDFAAASGRRYLTTHLFSTVLDVRESGVYQWDHSNVKLERLAAWLDGVRLLNGDAVRLEAGQHHLMMEVAIGACGAHEIMESYARFRPMSEAASSDWVAKAKRAKAHDEAVARIDAADGADSEARDWFAIGQQCAQGWVERALGDNGWNAEGEAYTQHALRQVLLFAHATRNATGRDLTPGRALPAIFPQYVAKTIFRRNGVSMPSNGPGGGPLGVDNWARGFGLVEERFRFICLAAWDRTQTMAQQGAFTSPYSLVSDLDACSAAFRFVNHPGTPAPDTDPATVLPRTMIDTEKSGFLFRDGWRGDDDCVVSILAEPREPSQSWGNYDQGDLRWSGLGCDWAERGIPAGNGINLRAPDRNGVYPHLRQFGSVIQIPGCKISERGTPAPPEGRCRILETHLLQDGSGVITLDLSGSYVGAAGEESTAGDGKKATRFAARDLGITAIRSVAVDHSGISGAPSLVAVADKLTGTKGDETWQFCTAPEHKVSISGNGFTIAAANGATLKATALAPADAVITCEPVRFKHEMNYHARHNQVELRRQVVKIQGNGSFFLVVMTIQRGEAPAVTGSAARAEVGKRTLRFADNKLHLE